MGSFRVLAESLEHVRLFPAKRMVYARLVLAAMAAIIVAKSFWFGRWGGWASRELADFDAFHIVAQRVWIGDLEQVYHFETLLKMQAAVAGAAPSFMPWTYPPQYGLLIAPFAFLPVGVGYLLFTASTLAFYIATLRALARDHFAHVLVVLFPALSVTIGCGQNGFLTAGLIGLICLNIERRPLLAGIALGVMVIKPHLVIAVSVCLLAMRSWVALAAAAAVVLASSLVCTILFGWQIWTAWFGAIRESTSYLEQGLYPLFRMISAYAALSTTGFSPKVAFWGQVVVAALALLAVMLTVFLVATRGFSQRFLLGTATIVSAMISPYAYDYDLSMLGVGLALLLPELGKVASPTERSAIYALILLAGGYGLLQSARLAMEFGQRVDLNEHFAPAIGGFAMMTVLALLLKMLWRAAWPALVPPRAAK